MGDLPPISGRRTALFSTSRAEIGLLSPFFAALGLHALLGPNRDPGSVPLVGP